MKRLKLILLGITIQLMLAMPCIAAESRPNVMLIVCDDLNTHVSTSGYAHIKTPAFDTLGARMISGTRVLSCQREFL